VISGEIKVAFCLRMLAGGSYLDLVPLFDVCKSSLYDSFAEFLDWVLDTLEFPLVRWLREGHWDVLNHLASQFGEKSNGVFFGPFASIYGIAIRIRSPSLSEVTDPGNYYCRKGFYALNEQGICDRLKRFLWCYPTNKGSTHDSAAFCGSKLYTLLMEKAIWKNLYEMGLFIAGDTAYTMTPFLLTPYDINEARGDINGAKDSFNFHLSLCRIMIECAFGELVMRWGILWRTLRFDLIKSTKIIQVCMLLHNHIVDCRSGDTKDAAFFRNFNIHMDIVQTHLTRRSGEVPRALVADNNKPSLGGQPTNEETRMRDIREVFRHRLTVQLASEGLHQPLQHDMHYHSHGNIYIG